MERAMELLRSFGADESGATATEYAVMLALIVMIALGAIATLGEKVSQVFVDAEQGW
jgi:pilus assembly protein Flp/PilA